MKRKISIALVVLLGLITTGYVACAEMFPSGTWRYKITVNVETPEGLKTGSVVREVRAKKGIRIGDASGGASILGEAVPIDVGNQGKIFALLEGDNAYRIVFQVFPVPDGSAALSKEGIAYYSKLKNVKGSVLNVKGGIPRFIRFRDLNDPKSVQKINISDEIYPGAGIKLDGLKLKDIFIEMTNEPVTWKIESTLPWLKDRSHMRGYLGSPSSASLNDPTLTYLTGSDLIQGGSEQK